MCEQGPREPPNLASLVLTPQRQETRHGGLLLPVLLTLPEVRLRRLLPSKTMRPRRVFSCMVLGLVFL